MKTEASGPEMVLVDTSSWIHFLRPDGHRERVEAVLGASTACWSPVVRLELWSGAGGERERKALRELERLMPDLGIDTEVWNAACDLAHRCRAAGVTAPATDLLIAAGALNHGAQIA